MTQLDVKYILFSHFNKKVIDPKKPEKKIDGSPLKELQDIQPELKSLLDNPEHPGLLMLFWHPGWIELLDTVGSNFDPKTFAEQFKKSESEKEAIKKAFDKIPLTVPPNCPPKFLSDRIRLITADDLHQIVNNLRGDRPGTEASRLRRFLDGNQDHTLYDTAKVVEAIVHLRNLGSGIPILRVDWDVLFDKNNLTGRPPLGAAIKDVADEFINRHHNSRVFSFMYSARYDDQPSRKPRAEWDLTDWMKAYATRAHPALIADTNLLNNKISTNAVVKSNSDNYFNKDLLNTFYLTLSGIGGNPNESVTSGALLCMSDVAILDLPPCSSFDVNVMWIDDHLKYLLHQTLGHFKAYISPGPKLPTVILSAVNKERPDITDPEECPDIAGYVLGTYLPTLLRGCIFDYWICKDKKNPENNPGEFTMILQEALKCGYLNSTPTLKDRLVNAAIIRIEEVRKVWSALIIDDNDTFASLWVGDSNKIERLSAARLAGLGLLSDSGVTEVTSVNDLSLPIKNDIDKLIDDALVYIEWTLYWPNFIQAVRSIEPGRLRVDLIG